MADDLRCYEYINHPFERVRDVMTNRATGLFERATQIASGRADALVGNLKMKVAGFEVGKNVVIHVTNAKPTSAPAHMGTGEAVNLDIEWKAETNTSLFPAMHASLSAYPLSATETQLDLQGSYDPPGGAVGTVVDRLVGRRIAEAVIHRFLEDVVKHLGEELNRSPH